MRSEYHKAIDSISEISREYFINNYDANVTYNRILNEIESDDNELRSHFSGAYINDDGCLVVSLCCSTGNCRKEIEKNLAVSDVVFEDGTGSFYYGQEELEAVNRKIASLQEAVRKGDELPDNLKDFMQSKPRTFYHPENNTSTVIFNVSPEVKNAVLRSEKRNCENADESQPELSDFEILAVKQYFDLISTFRVYISNSEKITFTVCSGYEQGEDLSGEWRPGRGISVMGIMLSTGYRAKYTSNNHTFYGFVTCGHGTNVGDAVYLSNDLTEVNKIGIILDKSYGDRIDVSFIKMTNANYTNGQAIYYTSSQADITRPGTILDGTQTSPALNTCIFKSGRTTYLTSGYLSGNNCSGYWSDTYFYNLMQADRNMSDAGDSGAVTYIVSGDTVHGKAIGVLKGKTWDGYTVFTKASNITADFGAEAY